MSVHGRWCDVAVIGAGPAGLAAAARAAEAGAQTLVIDEGLGLGGQIWRPSTTKPQPSVAQRWVSRFTNSGAEALRRTSVVDVHRAADETFVIRAELAGKAIEVRASRLILATGARELFLPFPGWTLPGVVGIGGAQALLKAGLSVRDKRIVIAGSGPLMLPVAASLAAAGARVLIVAEQASRNAVLRYTASLWRSPAKLMQAATLRLGFARTPYATGTWVVSAHGDGALRGVMLTNGAREWTVDCDMLCSGFGLIPNTELANVLGCRVERSGIVVNDEQATTVSGAYAAGEPTGIGGVDLSLVEGEIAGLAATGRPIDPQLAARRRTLRQDAAMLNRAFRLRDGVRALATPETIVCRCEDVRLRDLEPRWTSRQAKLHTRAGMGPCQGRICGAALDCVLGWAHDSVRPPIQPARLSTIASEFTELESSPRIAASSSNEQGVD